ncbi:MAG: cytochrome c oxidase subunit 4 [Candidatus Baltobacteraceae bacterium]
MKTLIGLFLSSMTFSGAIALVYWFSSHEPAGTFLLGFMFLGFAWAAGYTRLAEKGSQLAGDDKKLDPGGRAGEDLGIVTKETPWPMLLACSILVLFIGVVWSGFLVGAGLGAALLCLWRLGAESARTGTKTIVTEEGTEKVT